MRNRSGITLMEVLISAFVLSVGLLGLASLLPVARYLMVDTSKYDRSNTLGRAALNDFENRNYIQMTGVGQPPLVSNPPPVPMPGATMPDAWIVGIPNTNSASGVTWTYESVAGTDAYTYTYTYTVAGSNPPVQVTLLATLPRGTYYAASGNSAVAPTQAVAAIRPPFIFDPLASNYPANSQNLQAGNTPASPGHFPVLMFGGALTTPGVASPVPALARITLNSGICPAGIAPFFAPQHPVPMPFAQAQRVFASPDELLFDMSAGREVRPVAALVAVPGGYPSSPNPVPSAMPPNDANFSYIVTLSGLKYNWNPGPNRGPGYSDALANGGIPTLASDDNNDGVPDDAGEFGWTGQDDILLTDFSADQSWKVAVTVIYNRDLTLVPTVPNVTAETPPPPERMVYASILSAPQPLPLLAANPQGYNLLQSNAGLGGGDVLLRTPNPGTNPSVTPNWLDVKPNEWLMLSAFPSLSYGSGAVGGPKSQYNTFPSQVADARWYRIVSVGDIRPDNNNPGGIGGWMRQVTLAGDDWPAYGMYDALAAAPNSATNSFPPYPGSAATYQTAFATLVTGAVAVYEDTIEIGH